jgi:hypothetical protein
VFDELLELHKSLASDDTSSLEAMRSNDAFELSLDREALERAAGLVDAVAALAGDSGLETGVVARADATRKRLELSLDHLREKQSECFEIVSRTTKMRRDALHHALEVAEKSDGEDEEERDAMEEMETAFADAAADADVHFKVAYETTLSRRSRPASSDDDDDANIAPSSRRASPEKTAEVEDVEDDVEDSSSSLDDVIDRELRNQRVTRARARARANAKVVEATAEARRAVEAEARSLRSVGDATESASSESADEGAANEKEDHPEDASLRAERDRRSKRKLRRRLVRDALVALPVLVFLPVRHGAGRAAPRRGRRARREAARGHLRRRQNAVAGEDATRDRRRRRREDEKKFVSLAVRRPVLDDHEGGRELVRGGERARRDAGDARRGEGSAESVRHGVIF